CPVDGKQFGGPGRRITPGCSVLDRCGAALRPRSHSPEALSVPTATPPSGRQSSSRNRENQGNLAPAENGGRFFFLLAKYCRFPSVARYPTKGALAWKTSPQFALAQTSRLLRVTNSRISCPGKTVRVFVVLAALFMRSTGRV